jgi:NADH-quinone oxidoreductase subunit N
MIRGTDLYSLLPFLIVIGWACILLLIDLFIPKDRKGITAFLAALGLIAALVVTVWRYGESEISFSRMIMEDGFSHFLQLIFLATGLAGIGLAYDYIKRREIQRGEYYTLLLFTVGGMMLMALAGDLIVVFLALELLSIPLYVLSGFARPQEDSEEAAMKYFLLGAFASSFVVYGIALVYGATQTTQFEEIVLSVKSASANTELLVVGAGLILVGLGFKVAAVPFHMWTPDVYQGAPSSVTGFMSVGAKAGGFAALLRVFIFAFPGLSDSWSVLAMIIAALTMAWGNIAAIAQPNIKRMLAYSSIAHAGYILMILPAAADSQIASDAVSAALFYILAYAVTNLGAWGVVLALEKKGGGGLNLEDYAGLGTKNPGLALAMAIFMFSLTGIPPTAGFMGKFYIFRAVIEANLIWLAIVGVVTSLISAYYYLRIIIIMYMRPGEPETRSEPWLDTTVMVTGVLTFLLGILPGPLLALAGQAHFFASIP